MIKKFFAYILLTIIFFSIAISAEKTFALKDLNYSNDVLLQGISSVFTFYIPVSDYDNLYDNYLNIGYRYTEISGDNTIISVYANDLPISTFTIPEKKGMLKIPIPKSLVRANDFLKIELLIKLDYNRCDLVNVGMENLWFLISNDSSITLRFDGKKALNSIQSFFSELNGYENYNFVYEIENTEKLNVFTAVSEYIGSNSKGLRKSVSLSEGDLTDTETGNIHASEGETLELTDSGKKMLIGVDSSKVFSTDYIKFMNSATATVDNVFPEEQKTGIIGLGSAGLSDQPLEVVYNSQMLIDLPLGLFSGVPSDAFINLHLSSFDQIEEEKIYMSVFFNGFLIGKTELKNHAIDEIFSYRIPEGYFSAFNSLKIVFRQYNAPCKSSYVKIYGDSNITFSGNSEIGDITISQFPSFTYGKTLYLISDSSTGTASMLLKLSYLKGLSDILGEFGKVVTVEEFFKDTDMLKSYDSIIGILAPEDMGKFDGSLLLGNKITIMNADSGKKIFESDFNDEIIMARAVKYKAKPAFLLTYTKPELLESTSIDNLLEFKRVPGNLAILKDNRAISFNLGREIITVISSSASPEEDFWYRYRFIIVLCLVVIAIILLVFSYRKTSAGR